MKRRRTLIISLLLVAAIALGVGYAATTGSIKINGDVSNQPHALNLSFVEEGATATQKTEIVEAQLDGVAATTESSVAIVNDTITNISVKGIAHKDDYVKTAVVVKNNNEYDVKLLDPTHTTSFPESYDDTMKDFFTVSYEWDDASDLVLAKGETKVLYVTVTMAKTTGETLEGDFVITVPAESAS